MASEIQTVSTALREALLRDFKAFYRGGQPDFEQLGRLYTDDIEFRDPVHTLHGRLALKRYLRKLYANCHSIRFEYTAEDIAENGASIAWIMHLSHPALAHGREIPVRGISMVRFSDRIYYQEDFYDMGSLVYRHVPLLGRIIRHINDRLAN